MIRSSIVLWGLRALAIVVGIGCFLLTVAFFTIGMEGLATSAGWVGTPGTLIVTGCTPAGRGQRCYGSLFDAHGEPIVSNVTFQGDGSVGDSVPVRVWDGDPETAWATDGSAWSDWVPQLISSVFPVAIFFTLIVRRWRRHAPRLRLAGERLSWKR